MVTEPEHQPEIRFDFFQLLPTKKGHGAAGGRAATSPHTHSNENNEPRGKLFIYTLTSWCVRSSSLRAPASSATEGLTCGGGTGSTVITSQSGLEYWGFSPRVIMSSSLMFLKISCTFSRCFAKAMVRGMKGRVAAEREFVAMGVVCAERRDVMRAEPRKDMCAV